MNTIQRVEKMRPKQTWQPRSIRYDSSNNPWEQKNSAPSGSQCPTEEQWKLGCQGLPRALEGRLTIFCTQMTGGNIRVHIFVI